MEELNQYTDLAPSLLPSSPHHPLQRDGAAQRPPPQTPSRRDVWVPHAADLDPREALLHSPAAPQVPHAGRMLLGKQGRTEASCSYLRTVGWG